MIDREEEMLVPIRPGEILADEFMQPLGMSANKLAKALAVPTNRISEIIKGRRTISADTALRLSEALGTTPEFWMNLQSAYDIALERQRSLRENRKPISQIGVTTSGQAAPRALSRSATPARAGSGEDATSEVTVETPQPAPRTANG